MCNECCKEFKGWCKSFTRTETLLSILEVILLVVCIGFLIFLILHFIICASKLPPAEDVPVTPKTDAKSTDGKSKGAKTTDAHDSYASGDTRLTNTPIHTKVTAECTWEPSKKTAAATRYYEQDRSTTKQMTAVSMTAAVAAITKTPLKAKAPPRDIEELALDDQSDGEDADESYNGIVLALVKMKPPRDIAFGCILTAISDHWTLTAASCLDSIEEVDTLDSFVMMEGYGRPGGGRTHAVSDVRVHPSYQGGNTSFDLAALRSADRLRSATAQLPTMLDYFLITVGERFTLLGFGGFRTVSPGGGGRALRAVRVHSLPARQCAAAGAGAGAGGGEDAWAPRHLHRGQPVAHAPCAAAPLCAGVLYARGTPCNYCAGSPLVRARRLLGVMSDARACGLACEPAPYANLAAAADWLTDLHRTD